MYNGNGTVFGSSVPISPQGSTSAGTESFTVTQAPQAALEYAEHYADLASQLLHGWMTTEWSDSQLHVSFADGQQSIFATHSLVVSRSPVLRQHLVNARAQTARPVLVVPISDPSITPNSLSIVLASLYSPTVLSHLNSSTAPSILASASFLGLDRLALLAFDLCEESIRLARTAEELLPWVAYTERDGVAHATTSSAASGAAGPSGSGASSPLVTPGSPALSLNGNGAGPSAAAGGLDGPAAAAAASAGEAQSYETRLRATLLDRLVRLPRETGAFGPAAAGKRAGGAGAGQQQQGEQEQQLVEVLKRLPFDMFKSVVEDKRFEVESDMLRFNFAKKVVAARKQLVLSSAPTHAPNGAPLPPPEFEETVVLGFGGAAGSGGSAVNVLRKVRKPQLWKIGNSM
ncbi:hypothetical protein Rhopal_001638-T1 [Rhodotorula paludigena]|uniref:BTB domain-containing protein n=1 Tax=Rhodotorula paludigena TaxID=86838 RepID=A0AAV5GHW3_9BASI|nr:hypothetical protein Rhopal_001638-T1 [Rhodotorula paludigena]